MKNETKVKKLMLRKETLRDLTARNAGAIKGGMKKTADFYCTYQLTVCYAYTCKCHGRTYNQKCLG